MQQPAEDGSAAAAAPASTGASDAQQPVEQTGSRGSANGGALQPSGGRKGRGSRSRAKVADISQPPQFAAAAPRGSPAAQDSFQAGSASTPASLAPSRPASADEQPSGEAGERAGPSPRRLREFWEAGARGGAALPRPRTPQRHPGARAQGAVPGTTAEEAAICDRLGTPVLSLRVPSGISRALASVDTLSASLPSLARLRQAAAGLTGAAGPPAAPAPAPAAAPAALEPGEAAAERQAGTEARQAGARQGGGAEATADLAGAEPARSPTEQQQQQQQQPGGQVAGAGEAAASSRAGPGPAPQHADGGGVEAAEAGQGGGTEAAPNAGQADGSPAAPQPDAAGERALPGGQQPADDAAAGSQLAGETSCAGAARAAEAAEAAPPVLDCYRPRSSLDVGVGPGPGSSRASASRASSLRAASERGSLEGSEAADEPHGSSPTPSPQAAAREAALPPALSALQRGGGEAGGSGRGSDADPRWRAQPKHVFILSNAGKPVFSLHGQEDRLAGLMAVVHAMVAFAADRGDGLRSLRAGRHTVVFLVRGPLTLVAAAATGEPPAWLRAQLGLLHGQLLAILSAGFERAFARNPRFDARRLLGGAEGVLCSLLSGFETAPWALLAAFPPVPLPLPLRQECLTALQAAVRASGALHGLLLAGGHVAALAQSRAHPLAPSDLLLLANFVAATPSFRQAPESFSPVCLPALDPAAFLHAYVAYLHLEARVCLVLLSPDPAAFHRLSETAQGLRSTLRPAIQAVAAAVAAGGAAPRLADLPPAAGGGPPGRGPLLHFAYKSPARGQAVAPQWAGTLQDAALRKELMAAYARVHAAMHPERSAAGVLGPPARRVHWEQGGRLSLLAVASAEYELYAAFDALVERGQALDTCQRLAAWVKREQATLFVPV